MLGTGGLLLAGAPSGRGDPGAGGDEYRLVPDAARPVRAGCLGDRCRRVGIVPLIRDGAEASPHDVLHFDFERQWAVRRGDWKLICNAIDVLPNDRNKTLEGLYLTNLKIDRTESENLIDRYPEKAQELLALRRAYEASLGKDKE